METYTKIGGARVGLMRAGWPLATLSAMVNKLTLKVRILGTYNFAPEQISAIESYVIIPVLAWGIRIRHNVSDYPENIIFWSLSNPDNILNGIRNSGFAIANSGSALPVYRGFPIRWSAAIIVVVVWSALFLLASPYFETMPSTPGWRACIALLVIFCSSIGTLYSSTLQSMVLKPDRKIGEIKPLLRLLVLISGVMFVGFSIALSSGAFNHLFH